MPCKSKKQRKYAKGGQVDNILARLTEGEFVIKKDSAQKIGYDVLEHLNSYGKIPTSDARKRSKK